MPKPLIIQLFTVPQSLVFIDGLPAFLVARGYEVHTVSAAGSTLTVLPGATHHAVPFTRRITPVQDANCLLKTYRLFRRLAPAIVHGNTPKAGLIGMLAAWLAGVPVRIYEIHGFPFESRRGRRRYGLIQAEKLTCRLATRVIAVSASVRDVSLTEGIVELPKVSVLHNGSCNGVDALGRFHPARPDPEKLTGMRQTLRLTGRVIGFVGRLTRDKGIYELLQAWPTIRADYPDVTLLLVGEAEADFTEQAPLAADERIRAVGHVTDVSCYYALMDFLVLPTHREGFGNVLIEAAAMERPAVAARVTGTVDAVVDNQTGLFCEPCSVTDLTRQLRWYLDNPALVGVHGQNARQRVLRDFVPDDIRTARWHLYERLLTEASRATKPPNAS